MAPIPATITVNFIANYAGGHRVCWRTGGAGAYDCSTIVTCLGGGSPCSASIPITVDNETCSAVLFDGYVQAICEVEGSLNGRVTFATNFIPNPTCDKYDITCTSVAVESFPILASGDSYVVGSDPAITVGGGGGSGAAGHGVVGDGGVKTWTITAGGAGYNGGGSATFNAIPAVNITGTGVGATFNVTVTAGVITAIALNAVPTSPGTGYAISDTFQFSNALLGGTGAGVVITVNTINTGEIQYTVVDTPGSGYSSTPSVSIVASPGINSASVSVVLAPCSSIDLGDDCPGNAIGVLPGLELNEAYHKCSDAIPVVPAGYVSLANGCCYDCVYALFQNPTLADVTVYYTDCATSEFTTTVVPASSIFNACIVSGSETYPAGSFFSSTPTCP